MSELKRRSIYQYGTLVPESRKRGPSVWAYRFLQSVNGKRRRRKVILGTMEQLPTRMDAERACEHLRLAANKEESTRTSPTMRGLVDRYIREVLQPCLEVPLGGEQDEARPMSFQNAKSYRSTLNKYVLPRWEKCRVEQFEEAEVRAGVEEWLRSLQRSSRNPNGLAPKTVRSVFNVMRLAFKFSVKWGYLAHNPLDGKRVELPRGSSKRSRNPVQLTASEFFKLCSLLGVREKLAVSFAGWLGTRVSEAFGLRWEDLDLNAGVVTFHRGFVQGRITPLKTEASRTNMALPEDVLESLRAWRSVTAFNKDADWVFASPHTKGRRPFWPGEFMKSHVLPVALKAGLPRIGWHSFRHTLSAWAKQVLGLEEAKTLLRHEDVATTSNIYGQFELQVKRQLQQRLVKYVKKQAEAQGWKEPAQHLDADEFQ